MRYREVSAAQPSYILPTPATVVGAFAYPLARILGLTDAMPREARHGRGYVVSKTMKIFLDSSLAASAGVSGNGGLVMHQELSKINATIYKGETEASKMRTKPYSAEFYNAALPRIFPVQAVGATYGPGLKLYLTWVVDVEKLVKNLGKEGIKVGEEDIDSAGLAAALGVSRLGSKEGIVAVDPASSGYEKSPEVKLPGEAIKTNQYVTKTCVEAEDLLPIVELPSLDYEPRQFYVVSRATSNVLLLPYSILTPKGFRVKHPCRAYSPRNGDRYLFTSVGV